MKLALIGYGKMGKAIEKIAKEKGHEIKSIIDPNYPEFFKNIDEESLKDVDVCLDFSNPQEIINNIKKVAELKKSIVVGTTGWYDSFKEVKELVENKGIGLIWSGNFSIGVNAFFRIVENASKLFNNLEEYDVLGCEIHHKNKLDSPSGTAKMLGELLINNIERKEKIIFEKLDRKIESNELHFSSIRGGSIPGVHKIIFDSNSDTIELNHVARGREGFATGALIAAEFINRKKGFYNINDLMDKIMETKNV
jgi:4-hydroxy-tetrahydrodipicolinate reductase